MKTVIYLRNAALTLILVLISGFCFGQNDNRASDDLQGEKTEFANAGYWIDAVVVKAGAEKSDRELLAGKGYYIDPVVVTYYGRIQEFIDAPHDNVFFTRESTPEGLEVSMIDEDIAQ
jgi:hypothetical protein